MTIHRPRRTLAFLAGALAVAVTLVGCGGDGADGGEASTASRAGVTRLKLGSSFRNLSSSVVVAGIQQGFFTKHGIDVQIVDMNGNATNAVTATLTGDVDLSFTGVATAVGAVKGGATDLRVIGNMVNKMAFEFITSPDINRPKDLEGKKCMVNSKGSTPDVVIRYVLGQLGVDVRKVTILAGGDEPTRLTAVETGQVECTVQNIGTIDLSSPKVKILKHVYEYDQDLPQAAFIGTGRWLAAHKDLATDFMKGLVETMVWAKKPANLDTLTDVGVAQLNIPPQNREVLKSGFQTYTATIWPTYPVADDSGMDFLLASSGLTGLDTSRFFDDEIVRSLQDAKFAESLS